MEPCISIVCIEHAETRQRCAPPANDANPRKIGGHGNAPRRCADPPKTAPAQMTSDLCITRLRCPPPLFLSNNKTTLTGFHLTGVMEIPVFSKNGLAVRQDLKRIRPLIRCDMRCKEMCDFTRSKFECAFSQGLDMHLIRTMHCSAQAPQILWSHAESIRSLLEGSSPSAAAISRPAE